MMNMVFKNKCLTASRAALLTIVLSVFFSCKKETTPPLARIPLNNLKIEINPAVQPPLTHYLPINDVQLQTFALLADRGIDTAEITSIRPSKATLTVLFGGYDLDFIDAVSFRLCPLGNNEPNCGREVFYRDPTPFDLGSRLDLVPSNVDDVRDMLFRDEINVQLKLERLRDYPQGTFDVVLDMEFEVR